MLVASMLAVTGGDELNFLDYVSKAGVVVLLVVILYGGFKQEPWWVFGWQYRAVVEEKEEWKEVAKKAAHIGESAAVVGEHLVQRNKALREGE